MYTTHTYIHIYNFWSRTDLKNRKKKVNKCRQTVQRIYEKEITDMLRIAIIIKNVNNLCWNPG